MYCPEAADRLSSPRDRAAAEALCRMSVHLAQPAVRTRSTGGTRRGDRAAAEARVGATLAQPPCGWLNPHDVAEGDGPAIELVADTRHRFRHRDVTIESWRNLFSAGNNSKRQPVDRNSPCEDALCSTDQR